MGFVLQNRGDFFYWDSYIILSMTRFYLASTPGRGVFYRIIYYQERSDFLRLPEKTTCRILGVCLYLNQVTIVIRLRYAYQRLTPAGNPASRMPDFLIFTTESSECEANKGPLIHGQMMMTACHIGQVKEKVLSL
jgi:hypothetical protein